MHFRLARQSPNDIFFTEQIEGIQCESLYQNLCSEAHGAWNIIEGMILHVILPRNEEEGF